MSVDVTETIEKCMSVLSGVFHILQDKMREAKEVEAGYRKKIIELLPILNKLKEDEDNVVSEIVARKQDYAKWAKVCEVCDSALWVNEMRDEARIRLLEYRRVQLVALYREVKRISSLIEFHVIKLVAARTLGYSSEHALEIETLWKNKIRVGDEMEVQFAEVAELERLGTLKAARSDQIRRRMTSAEGLLKECKKDLIALEAKKFGNWTAKLELNNQWSSYRCEKLCWNGKASLYEIKSRAVEEQILTLKRDLKIRRGN